MAERRKNVLSGLVSLSIFLGILCAAGNGYAQVGKLTEDNVTKFIEKTTEITSGQNLEMSNSEIIDYLERHLDKKARFKSVMKYNIPGYPSQETSMSLDKDDFVKSIEDGSKALSDYESKITVDSVRISKDGQKATVQTTGFEKGVMPFSSDGVNKEDVPVEGQSNCNQIISLNDGVIQMYGAQCTTSITFLTY